MPFRPHKRLKITVVIRDIKRDDALWLRESDSEVENTHIKAQNKGAITSCQSLHCIVLTFGATLLHFIP